MPKYERTDIEIELVGYHESTVDATTITFIRKDDPRRTKRTFVVEDAALNLNDRHRGDIRVHVGRVEGDSIPMAHLTLNLEDGGRFSYGEKNISHDGGVLTMCTPTTTRKRRQPAPKARRKSKSRKRG